VEEPATGLNAGVKAGKLIVALFRREGVTPEEFGDDLLAGAPDPGIVRYAVSLLARTGRASRADAFIEAVFTDLPREGSLDEVLDRMPTFADIAGTVTAFWVHERVKLDFERTWVDGTPTPGVKAVYLAQRHPSLTRRLFDQHWDERHAPLALTHHVGMWRYVQNAVVAQAGDALPEIDGIAELWFPTVDDFDHHFIDSPAGLEVIRRDVAAFAVPDGPPVHLMTEHILRS